MVSNTFILRSAVSVKVAGDCDTSTLVVIISAASAAVDTAVAIQPKIGVAFFTAPSANFATRNTATAGDVAMSPITNELANCSHMPLLP